MADAWSKSQLVKDCALIIFYRNAELGKVKTRLAATLGDKRALDIYLKLSKHTLKIAEKINAKKIVYYSQSVEQNGLWPENFLKEVQLGNDLGERMLNAFRKCFEVGYKRVCIIGTDCYELDENVITQAFDALKENDAVIGPAKDGGYYLLGMNQFLRELFQNKVWSTSSVAQDTIQNFKRLKLKYHILPILNDIDREEDLPPSLFQDGDYHL